MATVRIDYELTIAGAFNNMLSIIFNKEEPVRLVRDRVGNPPPTYKSNPPTKEQAYYVHTRGKLVSILAIATGKEGFSFTMTVTFTRVDDDLNPIEAPFTATETLEAVVDKYGKAILDTSVFFDKPVN